ncbi:hypothetical protein TWF506_008492 [Arthrobotrys conoides]|uniref:Uncharacterized protein n=1 Tax=Arthrobotrys conoides TaxID=74498 RepID=A0AAN8PFU4_9PEZI
MKAFTCSHGALLCLTYILLQTLVCTNAAQLRISTWDWELYLEENSQALKNILLEIGVFKTAREAHCAVGGPNDHMVVDPEIPTSLYYSTNTLKIALKGFQTAIDNAADAAELGSDPGEFLQDFGFEDIENALVSERRLIMTITVYENMIAEFLESGELMDEFPSVGHPTSFEDHNIRALARLVEGATLPGANLMEDVKIDSNSRPLFIDYWQSLLEEAQRKRVLAIAGTSLAVKYFDTDGFTELIGHRSGMPQTPHFILKVSGLLNRIKAFFACWERASQRVLRALEQLGDLPEPISNRRWMVKLDGKEIIGMGPSEIDDSGMK